MKFDSLFILVFKHFFVASKLAKLQCYDSITIVGAVIVFLNILLTECQIPSNRSDNLFRNSLLLIYILGILQKILFANFFDFIILYVFQLLIVSVYNDVNICHLINSCFVSVVYRLLHKLVNNQQRSMNLSTCIT